MQIEVGWVSRTGLRAALGCVCVCVHVHARGCVCVWEGRALSCSPGPVLRQAVVRWAQEGASQAGVSGVAHWNCLLWFCAKFSPTSPLLFALAKPQPSQVSQSLQSSALGSALTGGAPGCEGGDCPRPENNECRVTWLVFFVPPRGGQGSQACESRKPRGFC